MLFKKLRTKLAYLITPEILSLLALDCILLPLALFSAVWLRLGATWDHRLDQHIWLFFSVPLWTIPIFIHFGLYRAIIKYLDDKVVYVVFCGVGVSILILTCLIYLSNAIAFPRTSVIIFGLLALVYIGGSRFLLRGILRSFGRGSNIEPVILYGAGDAGVQLALSLTHGSSYVPCAFIDDDVGKWGSTIRGIKVYNPEKLAYLTRRYEVKKILLALPSLNMRKRREIIHNLETSGLYIQTLPGINDIISGDVKFSDLKDIEIDDLLGRDIIPVDENLLSKNIQGKSVLVTGAGGSIGSELVRQIAKLKPSTIVLFEVSEYALYQIEREIRIKFPFVTLVAALGSISNQEALKSVIAKYQVETIYHAAAYKHVPLVEANLLAGLENNVLGTLNMAIVACELNVSNVVLISTDKAVRPTNIMGASKRLAELILQAFASENKGHTTYSMVRFGNVLGSSGSVVPLFKRQIAEGGPITITHPDIIRYFMTIPEAVGLVIQAGNMAAGGEVFVLDMGDPVKIVDLARKMIYLSGRTFKDKQHPQGDIEIKYTGLRPGEKLFEELLIGNNPDKTLHDRIMKANEPLLEYDYLMRQLNKLALIIKQQDIVAATKLLTELVSDYAPIKP